MTNRRPPEDRPICQYCYLEITTSNICNCPDEEGLPLLAPRPSFGKKKKK